MDNCWSDECRVNEPWNRLGTIEIKWQLPTELSMLRYATLMGEDEAGYMPHRKVHLFGFSSEFDVADKVIKYYVEYSNTTVDFGEFLT